MPSACYHRDVFEPESRHPLEEKELSMRLAIGIVALALAFAIGASPAAAQGK
jgi:hypothetical protein